MGADSERVFIIKDSHMKEEKLKIIFVCVENARRSQMAKGFAEALGQGKLEVYSAGSRPSSQIDPLVIEVMKEKGIDLSGRRPSGNPILLCCFLYSSFLKISSSCKISSSNKRNDLVFRFLFRTIAFSRVIILTRYRQLEFKILHCRCICFFLLPLIDV